MSNQPARKLSGREFKSPCKQALKARFNWRVDSNCCLGDSRFQCSCFRIFHNPGGAAPDFDVNAAPLALTVSYRAKMDNCAGP